MTSFPIAEPPRRSIDLNCDLGEGYGVWRLADDAALLDVVTSANVACGFHAGDPATIDRTVTAAARRGVAVGAQVAYPDLIGFGRRDLDIDAADLTAAVLYQIGALAGFCRVAGIQLRYVKPHGALYNRIVGDPAQALAVVTAIRRYDAGLPLMTLPGSVAARVATEAGVEVIAEGFADRGYTPDGRLLPRNRPGAVLSEADAVVSQARGLVADGRVASLCVHSDTPGAVELVGAVRAGLVADGVLIEAVRR